MNRLYTKNFRRLTLGRLTLFTLTGGTGLGLSSNARHMSRGVIASAGGTSTWMTASAQKPEEVWDGAAA